MTTQPDSLRLADALENLEATGWGGDCFALTPYSEKQANLAALELRRLHAENEALRKAYQKMKNVAAAYSNLCDDNGSTRRLERQFDDADAIAHAAINAERSKP